eukprot:816877-Prorocentrum_minimum.AAC.2
MKMWRTSPAAAASVVAWKRGRSFLTIRRISSQLGLNTGTCEQSTRPGLESVTLMLKLRRFTIL